MTRMISFSHLSVTVLLFIFISALPASADFILQPNEGIELFEVKVHADTNAFTETDITLPGCFMSSVAWGDYDNDGDLDLLACGLTDSDVTFSKIFRNDSGSFVDINAPLIGVQAAHGDVWVDYDNDGDLDLMIMGSTGNHNNLVGFYDDNRPITALYRNDGGTFTEVQTGITPVVYGSVNWGDYDNDGDLDLIITGSPTGGVEALAKTQGERRYFDLDYITSITDPSSFISRIYRNDNGTFVDIEAGLPGVWGSSAVWGDYDNDGDLDIALMGWGGTEITKIFRNDNGTFADINAPLHLGVSGQLAWGDYDNDGDLDLIISHGLHWEPFTTIYRNDNGNFVDIQPGLEQVFVSAVAWGDYDNDGDLDLITSGERQFPNDDVITILYRNDDGIFTPTNEGFPGLHNSSVAWGDYDNDGDLDIVLSGGTTPGYNIPFNPLTKIFRNNRGTNTYTRNTRPSTPQNLTASISGSSVALQWDRATDQQTPQPGLLYNIRLGSKDGYEIISPTGNTSTGYLRVPKIPNAAQNNHITVKDLPVGNYTWSVQAVDESYDASVFASEHEFTIGTVTPIEQPGWQMVSVPYGHDDMSKHSLFSTAISDAYSYSTGYSSTEYLQTGIGYWMKFPSADDPPMLMGAEITSCIVPVHAGWNLIGSITTPLSTSSITSDPPGMTTSQFFQYSNGYRTTTTVIPGKGYWVKVNQNGTLYLSSASSIEKSACINIVESEEIPPSAPTDESMYGQLPLKYELLQNFPNPFNPSTSISYKIPEATHVTFTIYNMLGQQVASLVDKNQDAGYYNIQFNSQHLASGIYFYKLQAGNFFQTKKLTIIK
jgi:hypothetical protein